MTAHEITNGILSEVCKRWPRRARVWRANVVAANIGGRFVRAGIPGQADITGIIDGRRLEIEVKAGRDRQSEAQVNFASMIIGFGGIYLIARDVDGCLRDLAAAVGDPA